MTVQAATIGTPLAGEGSAAIGTTYVAVPSTYATAVPAFGPGVNDKDDSQAAPQSIQYKKRSYFRRAYVPHLVKTSEGELTTVIDKETPMDYFHRVGPIGLIFGAVARIVD